MNNALKTLSISGFKSLREFKDFKLSNLNVLIGANGSGKSNFIEIFRILREMMKEGLDHYIKVNGGSDGFLFNGPKITRAIHARFTFALNEYEFELEPTKDERFIIKTEKQYIEGRERIIGKNEFETRLRKLMQQPDGGVAAYIYSAISDWVVYHFHDTSATAAMRKTEIVEHNKQLEPDAGNIAPFLLNLKINKYDSYLQIVNVIQLIAPFFDDFILDTVKQGEMEKVKLSWKQKGSDYPMQPYHFSDGTIRFICLATALLQPKLPSAIVIDEPELGLHPYAIEILAELIQAASKKTQLIISTQSPALIDCFSPEDIIVVNRKDGASTFERLDPQSLEIWLEDYSLGTLWRKNVVVGGPVHE